MSSLDDFIGNLSAEQNIPKASFSHWKVVVEKLDKSVKEANAKSIATFDFSTLYHMAIS